MPKIFYEHTVHLLEQCDHKTEQPLKIGPVATGKTALGSWPSDLGAPYWPNWSQGLLPTKPVAAVRGMGIPFVPTGNH